MNVPDSVDIETNNIGQPKINMKTIGLTTIFGANKIFKWVHEGTGAKRLRMYTAEILLQHPGPELATWANSNLKSLFQPQAFGRVCNCLRQGFLGAAAMFGSSRISSCQRISWVHF